MAATQQLRMSNSSDCIPVSHLTGLTTNKTQEYVLLVVDIFMSVNSNQKEMEIGKKLFGAT